MLFPGCAVDAEGRIRIVAEEPTDVLGGVGVNASRQVCYWGGDPTVYANGLGLTNSGRVAVELTTTASDDSFSGGYRFSNTGRLRAVAEAAIASFNNGDPFDSSGRLVVTTI